MNNVQRIVLSIVGAIIVAAYALYWLWAWVDAP